MEIWQDPPDDPETVRRAAAILEAYVSKASLMALRDERRGLRDDDEEPEAERMSRGEALEVLGLEPGADEDRDPCGAQAPAAAGPSRPWRLGLSRHGESTQARDTLLAALAQDQDAGRLTMS